MSKQFDIIIVGGGAVGASLALALARYDFAIALVDGKQPEDRSPADKDNRIFALATGTKAILDRLGVWPLVKDFSTRIEHIHASNKGSFGAMRMHAADYDTESLGYMLACSDLQAALNKQLEEKSITQFCPATFKSQQTNDEGVLVCIDTMQGEVELEAKLLIAADGANSFIRQAANIETIKKQFDQQAVVATVQLEKDHGLVAYERFLPRGAIALLPHGEKRCALIWSATSDDAAQLMAHDEREFLKTLQSDFGYRLGRLASVSKRMTFPLQEVVAQKSFEGKTVFVGNAVQTLHPIAAQGLNLALRNAALLADSLFETREQGEVWHSEAVLKDYDEKQVVDQQRTRSFTNALVQFFDDSGLAQFKFVRGSLLRAFDCCPPAKRHLLKGMMKGVDRLVCSQN